VESVSDALKIWKSLLCHVCFLESSFRETTFQTFLCLFGIRKVGQRKTLSGCFPVNRKHFPVKENFGLVSRKVFFLLAVFVFRKVVSGKSLSKLLLKTNLKARHLPL
jgi:hypothetical protein